MQRKMWVGATVASLAVCAGVFSRQGAPSAQPSSADASAQSGTERGATRVLSSLPVAKAARDAIAAVWPAATASQDVRASGPGASLAIASANAKRTGDAEQLEKIQRLSTRWEEAHAMFMKGGDDD